MQQNTADTLCGVVKIARYVKKFTQYQLFERVGIALP